ncbi:E4 SUMO-protein ligase PIAL2-like isoform X2 [Chenopodium quinoa]|uniref:E4 SUMO-protein ligase PIAL2-like isoform X2 n=1 Tax=Chenopodium quinoa TaxID=63459 RepID=UPI000B776452|nr:E4 SUMO-protein ligase PIAL2-like isoform X2 [Chenopodium quinoa]
MSVVYQVPAPVNDGGSGKTPLQLALEVNACRVIAVAEQLNMCAQTSEHPEKFHHLCLALSRGIDYGLANNEVPAHASKLPPVLKKVCSRKDEIFLQASIMVLMISVKNACKLGWFSAQDTKELLNLADEVSCFFVTKKDGNTEVCNFLPTVSTIMARYYPRFKLGHVIASLEVEPGYGTHLVDFHISKDIKIAKEEKIYLFVAMKDNIDTSSCIVTPRQVNILLNGNAVDHRSSSSMDHGPQLPTIVNSSLKYGINLLQVVGQFNGHCILSIALMSVIPFSALPVPPDYDQPAYAALSSDSEIIEGPSRVSLNCPISKTRIKMPVKGNSCKHYQCFDFSNYVEIMSKRPSWRCPSCNQTVCFTDLRVDQKMVKVLQEVGENISEVILSIDGSWTAVSNHKRKEVLPDNTSANQQEGHELDSSSDILEGSNMYDLTGEDDDMEIADRCEPIDVKPVIQHNIQGPCAPSNITLPPVSRCTTELNQYSSAQAMHSPSLGAGLNSSSIGFNIRPQAHFGGVSGTSTGNYGMTPVLTDAVTPALNRQTDNFQGTNCPANSMHNNLQLQDVYSQELLNNFLSIPRNVRRDPSAIQALPVPQIPFNPLHHARPTVRFPAASGSSAPFQGPVGSNAHASSPFGNTVERQRNHLQSHARPLHLSNSSLPNHSASSGMHHMLSQPPHLMHNRHHSLSQPPHLARTSLPRNDLPHGGPPRAGLTNSPSTLQRVQLPPQASLGRQLQSTPLHTQAVRMPSSLPQHLVVTPQAVTRPENLIDFQSEQNWRPSGRMRGALTGEAYSHALSQYMGQATQVTQPAQTPIPRPSALAASSLPPSLQVQMEMANRRIASELEDRSATSATTISGTVGSQAETSRGLN